MGLLTPLYLLGLAALALPVVFHLLRKAQRKEFKFSSLIFLRQSPPRLTRRSRIENWWLLLLRAVILAFLVFAFTRPLFRTQRTIQREEEIGDEIIVLVDQSASMQRGELWSEAQAKVREILDSKASQDRLSLFVFDRTARVVVDATLPTLENEPEQAVRSWLEESKPGWDLDDLPASIQAAIDWYTVGQGEQDSEDQQSYRQAQLHVVSDFQAPPTGSWNQIQWPDTLRVTLHRIDSVSRDNASLTMLQSSDGHWDANQLNIRVSNDRNAQSSRFTLTDSENHQMGEVVLPPGESRVISMTPTTDPTTPWQLRLTGDLESFDNRLDLPPVASRQVLVATVGDADEMIETTSWMLEQACKSLKYQEVQWENFASLSGLALDDYQALFLFRPLQDSELRSARTYLENGGVLIAALTQPITASTSGAWEQTLRELADWQTCQISEASIDDYALVASLDTTRPPLDVFRSSTFRDFTSIHFWRYRNCHVADTETRTLAVFDDGNPLLMLKSIGQGELLVMTAGWAPAESQLGQSSRFATLMIQLSGLRQLRPPLDFAEIGQSLELKAKTPNSTVRLFDLEGSELATSIDSDSYRLESPGLYRLETDGRDAYVIVQIPGEEREDAQTLTDQLQAMGIPGGDVESTTVAQERELRLEDEQLEDRQQIWRWLLVSVVLLVVFETFASGWVSRNRASDEA